MGLFDMFTGDSEEMTPHLAFAVSLIYMMEADGEFDKEEIGHLLSVLGGKSKNKVIQVGGNNRQLLDRAFKYIDKNSLETFLKTVSPILSDAQKMCILINLIDSSLSDGEAEKEEQIMFGKFLAAFGVSEERFRPFFEVIVLKNDRSVFTNKNHPKNQKDYKVGINLQKS